MTNMMCLLLRFYLTDMFLLLIGFGKQRYLGKEFILSYQCIGGLIIKNNEVIFLILMI